MPHHLFLSYSGDMLPRWRDAFPQARSARLQAVDAKSSQPELVWIRVRSDLSVAEQVAGARQRLGEARFVVLSDIPSDEEALAAFSAAARGYCNSHAAAAILQQIAEVVSQGGVWMGEGMMQRLMSFARKLPSSGIRSTDGWADKLSEREREVALAVAAGSSNKEIAAALNITERTVKAHIGAIFKKLQVRDRLQLSLAVNGGND
jgi:two-component system nitrate/nitrite response regulator NarL